MLVSVNRFKVRSLASKVELSSLWWQRSHPLSLGEGHSVHHQPYGSLSNLHLKPKSIQSTPHNCLLIIPSQQGPLLPKWLINFQFAQDWVGFQGILPPNWDSPRQTRVVSQPESLCTEKGDILPLSLGMLTTDCFNSRLISVSLASKYRRAKLVGVCLCLLPSLTGSDTQSFPAEWENKWKMV